MRRTLLALALAAGLAGAPVSADDGSITMTLAERQRIITEFTDYKRQILDLQEALSKLRVGTNCS